MTSIGLCLLVVWAFGWGYWVHDAPPLEATWSVFWPILWPAGLAYHRWRWGPKARRRYIYRDTRWWQRGDRERRP